MRLEQLGRYEIFEELGRGAMGVVYRARDPLIDRQVAIKAISVGLSRGEAEAFDKRFDHEARSAGRLNHPNIVTIYDVGKNEEFAYIAMELLDGRSLRDLLDSGVVLPPATIADIAAQIADGLASAHLAGVIHCDIKPANVVVLASGLVKITDFGIAKLPTGSRTFTGSIAGSPKYISPEQVVGRPVDARSDVFSLGAVLYEVLTGSAPFEGTAIDEILHNVINAKPEAPSGRIRSLPPEFDDIVERAMAKHPDDRYQSAAEMAMDLRELTVLGPRNALGVAVAEVRKPAPQPEAAALLEVPTEESYADDSDLEGAAFASGRGVWYRQSWVHYGLLAALSIVVVAVGVVLLSAPRQEQGAKAIAAPAPEATRSQPSRFDAAVRAGADSATARATSPMPGGVSPPAVSDTTLATTAPQSAPSATPAAVARLSFAVTPWGEIYVDGRKTGITPPLKEISLPPGKHVIEIRNSTFQPYSQSVDLAADASVRIKHKFE